MNELNLFIDAAWPQEHTDCVWYLCDSAGTVLRQGRGEPRHWPGVRGTADGGEEGLEELPVNIILTGGQVACHRVRLPLGRAGRRPEVLVSALEDRLLTDPSESLILAGEADEDGLTPVAVLARERLRGILSLVCELGLEPRSAWADGHLLPTRDRQRLGRVDGGMLVLPAGKTGFAALDLPVDGASSPFPTLVPPGLTVLVHPGVGPNSLPSQLGLSAEIVGAERFPLVRPPVGGFLTGEFAPALRRPSLRVMLPAAKLAGALATLLILMILGEWAWLSLQVRKTREASVMVFQEVFPQAVVVDPVLQMQRHLDERRRQVGRLGSDDLLALLERFAGAEGLSWHRLDYSAGRFEAEVILPKAGREALDASLQAAGYRAELRELAAEADGRARVKILLGSKGL